MFFVAIAMNVIFIVDEGSCFPGGWLVHNVLFGVNDSLRYINYLCYDDVKMSMMLIKMISKVTPLYICLAHAAIGTCRMAIGCWDIRGFTPWFYPADWVS